MDNKSLQTIFSKNLLRLLNEKSATQSDLAKFINVSNTTINNYIKGYNMPRMDKIDKICRFLNVNRSDLLEEPKTSELQIIATIDKSREYTYIPDPVAAGVPETIEGTRDLPTITIPDRLLGKYANNKNIIIMRVNGESMNKIFPSNSLIGVLMNYDIKNLKDGDLVVFNHNYEYSVKHYYDLGDNIVFKPNSTDIKYTDLIFKKDENLNILGKVVMYSVILD